MPATAMQETVVKTAKRGRGRPKKYGGEYAVTVSYTLPPDLANATAIAAKGRGVSASDLVAQALTKLLSNCEQL